MEPDGNRIWPCTVPIKDHPPSIYHVVIRNPPCQLICISHPAQHQSKVDHRTLGTATPNADLRLGNGHACSVFATLWSSCAGTVCSKVVMGSNAGDKTDRLREPSRTCSPHDSDYMTILSWFPHSGLVYNRALRIINWLVSSMPRRDARKRPQDDHRHLTAHLSPLYPSRSRSCLGLE